MVPWTTPRRTGSRNMLSTMKPQSNHWLVANMCANIAVSTARMATATHRHGWRTGTARIASGRARSDRRASLGHEAGLISGVVMAPFPTPHLSRICL